MGVKNWLSKKAQKASDKIAKLSALSPEQLDQIEKNKDRYYALLKEADPAGAVDLTEKLIAASAVEIFNAYLPQLSELYVPVKKEIVAKETDNDIEYAEEVFNPNYNIRYFNITKWVTDKEENSLEKLINVYGVLSNEDCNIALIFHRTCDNTQVFLAVTNNSNADSNKAVDDYYQRLKDAVKGNFPGSEWSEEKGVGTPDFLDNNYRYSVAACSNIPTEKSEKFISQTIEKLLDGIVPEKPAQNYTIILLATPIQDVEERKIRLAELYSGLAPYAGWQTNFTYTESGAQSSMATFGVNVGASAGVQNGQNQSVNQSQGQTASENDSNMKQEGESKSKGEGSSETDSTADVTNDTVSDGTNRSTIDGTNETTSNMHGTNSSHLEGESTSDSLGGGATGGVPGVASASVNYNHTWGQNTSDTIGESDSETIAKGIVKSIQEGTSHNVSHTDGRVVTKAIGKSIQNTVAKSTSQAVTKTIGKAVTNTIGKTAGTFKSVNLGTNFGVNFARASNVTATVGKNEGITQNFTNYNIKHALEKLEEQMKRFEESTALGMWDFAAYVLSEDINVANNVAHSYLALTQGEKSYMSTSSINLWRGDTADSDDAKEICGYLRELRHPVFGLAPNVVEEDPEFNVYPSVVTATTSLSGKELAYSLNFPKKSVTGLPVIECAEFGRNITSYGTKSDNLKCFDIGTIFHMNHPEKTKVELTADSLASHTFITGSTGSGKSNTVYKILKEAKAKEVNFLVIEPAKGEYKNVFGSEADVAVYGTNPNITPLLKLDPFSFPKDIHVLEHLDRLVEIFNVCWPMYAAMPAVLKSAVEKSYADCGWNLTESQNKYGDSLYPSFADVARNVKQIIDSSEYDTENKGAYKGSLLTRLNSLTNGINGMIFTAAELSEKQLFDENVIIDLSRVGSAETKSLLMGMLVLKLQEYRMTSGCMNSPLNHITVLEEAHNLLKRTSTEQPVEGGNLLGKSVEMIANAIAEMRTYGEGFIIADQAPGLLDMAAIRNTNTKIILRLPDQGDRELVGKAANLNDDQINELAKLPCGVAAVYQNEWVQPVLCQVGLFENKAGKYTYVKQDKSQELNYMTERLNIAELLSNGTKLDHASVLKDIRPVLDKMYVSASTQVVICNLLENPPTEPRMTKLAPIMSELFPDVRTAVEQAYSESTVAEEWTRSAESALLDGTSHDIISQVRRDIIQGVITDYIFNKLGKVNDLQKWTLEGGLR
ncbi:helicase HerA domain-containing protein [Ruminococcus flavefaciens]|uniref:helicase HerA domain-containing protein n=1 Tax=Ruminococcus flavefaciens TaxID=1265 RepID=UPI0026F0F2B4|nr:DUF87 domain-containing protein [Ruminococcus flavefaciens]